MNPTLLERELSTHLDALPVPPGDLMAVLRRARTLRRRRIGAVTAAAVLVAAVGGGAVTALRWHPDDAVHDIAPLGTLDAEHGLRAYGDPGHTIHLGGREVTDTGDFGWLDTDAVATPSGIVFFGSNGRALLLGLDGRTHTLGERPEASPSDDWHPSSAFDAQESWVAWTEPTDGGVRVVVFDLAGRREVNDLVVPCAEVDCDSVQVAGLDSGYAWVGTADGVRAWRIDSGGWTVAAPAATRIADARNRVVLYDERGPAPTALPDGWRAVAGPIDATLSFDGDYLLDWSSRLRPTSPGGRPLVLAQPPKPGDLAWWSFDTDGTVLVAVGYHPSVVYDCPLSTEPCERIGELADEGGDPMFIGQDM
ncbi:MAG: hypothetical protein U0R78_19055 [Nocardioidaceae bacterium]